MPLSTASAPPDTPPDLTGYWRVVKAEGLDAWLKVRTSKAGWRHGAAHSTVTFPSTSPHPPARPPHTPSPVSPCLLAKNKQKGGRLPLGPAPPRHRRGLPSGRHHPPGRPSGHPAHHHRQRTGRLDADGLPGAGHRTAGRGGPPHPHLHLVGGRRPQDTAHVRGRAAVRRVVAVGGRGHDGGAQRAAGAWSATGAGHGGRRGRLARAPRRVGRPGRGGGGGDQCCCCCGGGRGGGRRRGAALRPDLPSRLGRGLPRLLQPGRHGGRWWWWWLLRLRRSGRLRRRRRLLGRRPGRVPGRDRGRAGPVRAALRRGRRQRGRRRLRRLPGALLAGAGGGHVLVPGGGPRATARPGPVLRPVWVRPPHCARPAARCARMPPRHGRPPGPGPGQGAVGDARGRVHGRPGVAAAQRARQRARVRAGVARRRRRLRQLASTAAQAHGRRVDDGGRGVRRACAPLCGAAAVRPAVHVRARGQRRQRRYGERERAGVDETERALAQPSSHTRSLHPLL